MRTSKTFSSKTCNEEVTIKKTKKIIFKMIKLNYRLLKKPNCPRLRIKKKKNYSKSLSTIHKEWQDTMQ